MNRRGFELAISTLILLILGIVVLIGLVVFLQGGFGRLKSTSEPFLSTAETSAVREACRLACQGNDKLSYCCKNVTVGKEKILCSDSRLELDCSLDCSGFSCTK